MKGLYLLAFSASLILVAHTQELTSPCPDVFTYELVENDRWYGVIQLSSNYDLDYVAINIELDRKAQLFGSWYGKPTTADNIHYLISNRKSGLTSSVKVPVRVFVKYSNVETIPTIRSIQLNGRYICESQSEIVSPTIKPIEEVKVEEPVVTTEEIKISSTEGSRLIKETIIEDQEELDFDLTPTNACGVIAPTVTNGNGDAPSEGEWPWHAALYVCTGPDVAYLCAATLITTQHVLTAAHCVTKKRSGVRSSKSLLVGLGTVNLEIGTRKHGQAIPVRDVNVHYGFNQSTFENNLAVLSLKEHAEYTDWVRPICLWEGPHIMNQPGTVIRWGFEEGGGHAIHSTLPIVQEDVCRRSSPQFFSRYYSPESSYCAGNSNGTSLCRGDSGSGMIFPRENTDSVTWQLRGIVSLRASFQKPKVCSAKNYVIFMDLVPYSDWLQLSTSD